MNNPQNRITQLEKILSKKNLRNGTVIVDNCGESPEIFINGIQVQKENKLSIDETIERYCKENKINVSFEIIVTSLNDDNVCMPVKSNVAINE